MGGPASTSVRGDRIRVADSVAAAIAVHQKTGMPKHVEMAEAMLGEV